ncbi:hypothetical protein P8452_13362 [Trifolium repens]|nr:hypothetical protein P8452_13362 [Trifolium repens]
MKEEDLRKIKENAAKHKAPVKKQVFVPINDGRVQKVQNTTNNVIVNVETDTIHVEDTARISPQLIVTNPNNNDDGNSPRQQQQLAIQQREATTQQHEITTQQRKQLAGPILEPASPKSLMREHDKQLENELNDDDEDWSTDSKDSIVNDTQFGADAIVDNDDHVGEENNAIEGMNTPSPLVQNNGEAIKQIVNLVLTGVVNLVLADLFRAITPSPNHIVSSFTSTSIRNFVTLIDYGRKQFSI